jgi:hypothetical protein
MRLAVLTLALAAVLPTLPAVAQDISVFAGAGLSFDNADNDLNTDLSLYLEGETFHFYAGVSGDVVSLADGNYIDLYLGYRNETAGGISYDLSYDKTFYPTDSGSNYDTVAVSVGVPVGDKLTVTFDGDYYPDSELSDGYLTADYALSDKITLTASMGLIQNAAGSGGASKDFELAAAYQLGDTTSVTVHYYDGDAYDGYFALDLNWDTTLLGG